MDKKSEFIQTLLTFDGNQEFMPKALSMSYAREILDEKFDDLMCLDSKQLIQALTTAAYLGADSREILTCFLISARDSDQYFLESYDDYYEIKLYIPWPSCPQIIRHEMLLKHGKPPYNSTDVAKTNEEHSASFAGNLRLLKFLVEKRISKGIPNRECSVSACTAASKGHLDCLKYLYEKKYDMNHVCDFAAKNGQLACLQWAHEQGLPIREKTAKHAAQNGHLECLIYLHTHGCKWDATIFKDLHANCKDYVMEKMRL